MSYKRRYIYIYVITATVEGWTGRKVLILAEKVPIKQNLHELVINKFGRYFDCE